MFLELIRSVLHDGGIFVSVECSFHGNTDFISVERCLRVVFPIKYPTIVTPGRIKFVIGLTWLGACLCIVSAFILYPVIMKSEAMRIFILTGLCFSYLVIFLCYSMIYIKIRKQSAVRTELHGSRDKKPTFREGFPRESHSTPNVFVRPLRSSNSPYSQTRERKLNNNNNNLLLGSSIT